MKEQMNMEWMNEQDSRETEREETSEVVLEEETQECGFGAWCKDESGIGVVEVILILVILIGLVVIFKNQITQIVDNIFRSITTGVTNILK